MSLAAISVALIMPFVCAPRRPRATPSLLASLRLAGGGSASLEGGQSLRGGGVHGALTAVAAAALTRRVPPGRAPPTARAAWSANTASSRGRARVGRLA